MVKKFILCLMVVLTVAFYGLAFSGCDGCNDKTNDCQHVHLKTNEIPATCTLDGQKTVVCTDCNYVFPVEKIPALGHAFGDAEVTDATCESPKLKVQQCSRCGESVEERIGEPLGHVYKEVSTSKATCTDPEMINYECSLCGNVKSEPKENGQEALGHNYEHKPSGDKAATCTTAKEEYYECTRCGDNYSEVVAPPLGHTSDGVGKKCDPTCTEKGYTLKRCSRCNEDYKEDFVDPLGHDLGVGPTIAPTCDHMGYDTKVCSRCDYEEKFNATNNTAHDFDSKGICTVCEKRATDSFALTCGDDEIFAITKDGNVYTVYAPSYKWWNKLVMPAEVVQALYAQGVYSFDIKLGSNADSEMKAMSIKVQGDTATNHNVWPEELKFIDKYTFADAKGVFDSAKGGISFEVYYRVESEPDDEIAGKPRATCFAISFEYDIPEIPFDADDVNTYFKTKLPYSYDEKSGTYTFTGVKGDGYGVISLRRELLAYYLGQDYKTLDITLSTADGQRYGKNITAISNGTEIMTSGNTNDMTATLTGIDLQSVVDYDLDLTCYYADLYGTEWNPEKPMDRILITLTFSKDEVYNDVYAYTEPSGMIQYTSETSTTAIENDTITYTFKSVPDATFNRFYFTESYIAEKIAEGYTAVSFRITTWGSKEATLHENENEIGHLKTNGNDAFDCGIIALAENAYYYIRLYHNLSASDITVVVQFMKHVKAFTSPSGFSSDHGEEKAISASAPTENAAGEVVTYTLNVTGEEYTFVSFYAPLINEKIAEGYVKVQFTIDPFAGYKATWLEGTGIETIIKNVGFGSVSYDAIPLTINGYYAIRLYLAESMEIKITAQFLKSVYAYNESDNSAIAYTAKASTTITENDTITYTFKSVENGTFNRFYFSEAYIAEKIAEGYTDVSFVIDTWGNKAATLYENENEKGSVTTNGNDAFSCGVIELAENAYYYIRLYHNLGDESADITVTVQFIKPEQQAFSMLTTTSSYGTHYCGFFGGVSSSGNSVSVTAVKRNGYNGFTLTPAAIQAMYDLGFSAVSFTITSESGYTGLYNMSDPANCIIGTRAGIHLDEHYFANGTTITLNLANLVNDSLAMAADIGFGTGLKFIATSTAGFTEYDADNCTVTLSDITFIPVWHGDVKLKLATTTGDFSGSSGNLETDKAKLDSLYEAGFRYVDLSMYSFTADCDYMQSDWATKIAELKSYADSLGMTFVQAHSQGGNALDETQFDTLVAYTLRQIEICAALGIENIVVHPGFQSGYTKQQWFAANKTFFDVLLVKAEECGVNVLCENSTSKNLGDIYWANSGADMREFIEYVNNPYFHGCWDTGHANCEGPQYDDILALGDELYAIHFNDNLENGDFHLIPYYGTLNCDSVIRALNNIGYTGYFTFESDGSNRTNGYWHGPNDLPMLSGTAPSDLTREQQERLLYEIGEHLLKSYNMFAE